MPSIPPPQQEEPHTSSIAGGMGEKATPQADPLDPPMQPLHIETEWSPRKFELCALQGQAGSSVHMFPNPPTSHIRTAVKNAFLVRYSLIFMSVYVCVGEGDSYASLIFMSV